VKAIAFRNNFISPISSIARRQQRI